MAKLLNDRMSSQVHISNANRHARLCKRTKGAEALAEAIAPKVIVLKDKREATLTQKEVRDAAYDDVVYNDAALDDTIRNISDSAKQYDRNNPGRPIYNLLFPDGKYSDIVRAPFVKELGLAEQLSERLKSLGAEHELYAHVAPLGAAISNMQGSMKKLDEEELKVKTATANEELAQLELRKQYEFNYLDAAKLFGKKYADRLFPKSVSKAKAEPEVSSAEA
ncbi:hypothetical protein [Ancylomarina longa]|uniref:Uncharacterized protein n=1 Tax=Ancylomarina longa TaxID=2487017 RepID=A0A434AGT1_9BACT|nr:hypothetical protein [Ancylomarina longa]RUT73598.1 hypothetical protein DLK05_12270 [Ancylomarina longa]